MAEPKIALTMRIGAKQESANIIPSAGGEVKLEFDPAKVAFSLDYSNEDKLVGKLQGEVNLKLIGLPGVTLSGGTKLSPDKWSAGTGLEWEISSKVSAKIDYEHSGTGQSAKASVTIKW